METRFLSRVGLGGTIGLALVMGCSNQSAQQNQAGPVQVASAPVPVVVSGTAGEGSPLILATAMPPATAVSPTAPGPGSDTLPAPAIEQRVEQSAPPSAAKVSPAVQEIIKMAQAGVSEEVMLSYIDNSQHPFNLNSDGVVYLNDLGVTAGVITSMIQKDAQLNQPGLAAAPVAPAGTVIQTQVVSNVVTPAPPAEGQPVEAAPGPAPTYVTAPEQDVAVSYYYDSLAPYGSWLYVSGQGWCWQPTVVVNNVGWQPYCDAGRWYWSDSGWYWHSDYSWGWAPFHYGRWFHHGHAGWLWSPGTVWGPAWVSWRYTDGYCGWAPLPPAAGWRTGVGFTWYGSGVSIGFDFGLAFGSYAWVPANRFCDYNLRRYCEPHEHARSIYQNSTVINNYVVGNHNTVINHGVGRDTIAKHAGNELREVTIRERPRDRIDRVRPEQLRKEGPKLVVDRPALPRTPPRVPSVVAERAKAPKPAPSAAAVSSRPGAASLSGNRAPVTVVPEARPGRTTSPSGVSASPSVSPSVPVVRSRPASGPSRSENVVVGPTVTSSPPGRSSVTVGPTKPDRSERPSIYMSGPQKSGTPQGSAPATTSRSEPASVVRSPADPGPAAKPSNHEQTQQIFRNNASKPAVTGPAPVTARPEPRASSAPSHQPRVESVRPPSPFRQSAPEPRVGPAPRPAAPAYVPPAPSRAPTAPSSPSPAPSSGGQSHGSKSRSR